MGLFSKKKKESKGSCCEGDCNGKRIEVTGDTRKAGASVKILGSGCAKCNQLEANTKEALSRLGINYTISHVTDFAQIAAYGVMTTPALVVDDKVASYGKVLKPEEIVKILQGMR